MFAVVDLSGTGAGDEVGWALRFGDALERREGVSVAALLGGAPRSTILIGIAVVAVFGRRAMSSAFSRRVVVTVLGRRAVSAVLSGVSAPAILFIGAESPSFLVGAVSTLLFVGAVLPGFGGLSECASATATDEDTAVEYQQRLAVIGVDRLQRPLVAAIRHALARSGVRLVRHATDAEDHRQGG